MRILLKFADSLNFKPVGKDLFSRNFRLSFAKRPEKPLVKRGPRLTKDPKSSECEKKHSATL